MQVRTTRLTTIFRTVHLNRLVKKLTKHLIANCGISTTETTFNFLFSLHLKRTNKNLLQGYNNYSLQIGGIADVEVVIIINVILRTW